MPITNPLRKAMIVIAVSNYNGPYTNLPGTLTSARRIADWARQPGPGRGYTVLEITDSDGSAVTVERIQNEIKPFFQANIIDRLVVYFAGHGLVRSTADQYWLLTDAANDTREGVNMNAFKRGLTRQGIGTNHPDLLQGQLCFIVDACRNTSEEALSFEGDPIITGGGATRKMQIDLFFATMLGKYAYQPKGMDGQPPYCLFSDTLIDALEGKVPQVIETQHHPFKPVIVNNLLADYLDVEVPKRAARLNETMLPDNSPLIRMAHNYYDALLSIQGGIPPPTSDHATDKIGAVRDAPGAEVEVETAEMGEAEDAANLSARTKRFEAILDTAEQTLEMVTERATHWPNVIIETARTIAVPHGGDRAIQRVDGVWVYAALTNALANYPIFVEQGDQWLLVPVLDYTQAFLPHGLPGDVLLRKLEPDEVTPYPYWDTSLSTIATMTDAMPLRVSDVVRLADTIRYEKESKPNNANVAGYLYDFVGDIDNARRTAHYMVEGSTLPIDLALLAAERLRWQQDEDGLWQVRADLPAVEENTDSTWNRPRFAERSFKAETDVPVRGILPIFRQGWLMLGEADHLDLPPMLTEIAQSLAGRSAVLLPSRAMQILAETFKYVAVETVVAGKVTLAEDVEISKEAEVAEEAEIAANEETEENI